jgi:hypothetical protein
LFELLVREVDVKSVNIYNAILSIILALFLVSQAYGHQNPDTLWTWTYGYNYDEYIYAMQQTSDGGYVIAGYNSYYDFCIAKLNSAAQIVWSRHFGQNLTDYAYAVQQTRDGGYIVAGQLHHPNTLTYANYVKLDAQGNGQWAQHLLPQGIHLYSIRQNSDGGYIAAGYSYQDSCRFFFTRLDSVGDTLWTRFLSRSGYYNEAYSAFQTADGGFIIAGYTHFAGAGGYDYYLVKTNAEGDTLWTRTYGGYWDDQAYSAIQTSDGGYILAGTSVSFGTGVYDAWVVKTNDMGDTLWTRAVGGMGARCISPTSDGGYIIAGQSEYITSNNYDIYLVKIDSVGNILWSETYGGNQNDMAYSAQETADGGYIIAGYTTSFGAGGEDMYLVKTGPYQQTMVKPVSENPIPKTVVFYPNYPNPFNTITKLTFDLASPGWVNLSVFNILGEKVATLTNSYCQPGQYVVPFQADNLSSGIYMARLQFGEQSRICKMLYIK